MDGQPSFEPIYPKHAVERCAWSVIFSQPIPEKLYRRGAIDRRQQIEEIGLSQVPVQSFQFDSQTGSVSVNPDYGPIEFASPDGAYILSITPGAVTWQTVRYVRWEAFFGMAQRISALIVTPFLDTVSISALKLEYWDRFMWSGSWANMDPHSLLTDSGLIAPAAVRSHGAWHSHTGWFDNTSKAAPRLVNVNVAAHDFSVGPNIAAKPSVSIYTMLQDNFIMAGRSNIDLDLDAAGKHSFEMHEDSKSLLGRIISNEMQNRISLNPRG